MAKKTIFISYDYGNDRRYKNLLVAWDKNDLFDLTFYDASVDVSVNSTHAAPIKRAISARIRSASHFLLLVGKDTHKSDWVAWEIDKAVELGKKLVAVKIDDQYKSPGGILGAGATWAMSFTFGSIKAAIDTA